MVKRVEIRLTAKKKTWLRTEIKPEHLLLQLFNSFAGKWLEIFFYRQMVCPSYLYKAPDSSHEKISSNVVVKNSDLLVIMFFFSGAWCAGVNNKQQYLQVDFRGMRKVTKTATQGRPGSNDYVKSFKLSFSLDGNSFEFHREVNANHICLKVPVNTAY